MKVYLDIVILLNFLFDFILLCSVNYILRRNCNYFKIVCSSLFGEISLLLLFVDVTTILFLFIKVFISMIMIFICFGYKDSKYYFKNLLYFYLVSMLLGGAIQFLENQFSYDNDFNYLTILILGLFLYFKYIKSFKLLKNNYSYYYKCKIYFDENNSIIFNAFLDTGNKLSVPYLGKSIVLVDRNKICDLDVKDPIYVPYNSLNNHGLLECYKCLRLEIDGKCFDKFLVGVSNENFYIDGIDCIINNFLMEGLR